MDRFLVHGQGSSFKRLLDDVTVIDRLRQGAGLHHVIDQNEIFFKVLGDGDEDVVFVGRILLVLETPVLEQVLALQRHHDVVLDGFDIIGQHKNLVHCADERQLVIGIFRDFLIEEFVGGKRGEMELVENDKERNLFGDVVENADESLEKLVVLVFVFNRNNFLCALTDAAFPVFYINALVQRIDARIFKKRLKRQLVGIIPVIQRVDPIHQGRIRGLDDPRLELVIENLHDIAGSEHGVVDNVKRYGKGVVMLKEADIVILVIELLENGINKIAYI